MKHIRLSYLFSLCISLGLLISPLPLSAMVEDIVVHLSERDKNIVTNHKHESYIYLGQDLSNIIQLVSDINHLDHKSDSLLVQFKNHIDNGYNVAHYNAVIEVIEYMQIVVHEQHNQLSNSQLKKIICDIDTLVEQIHKGQLTVDESTLEQTRSQKNVEKSISRGNRSYTNIMTVKGLLSVNDQLVQNITAVDLSVTDTNIDNATIALLSSTDAIMDNVTITTLSVADLIADTIEVTNISVVDVTVTGTLSSTDAVIDTYLRFTDTAGGEYIGIQAPGVVPASYTISLPSTVPTANQVLQADATTPTNLNWVTQGGSASPTSSNTIYVAKYGNDSTGNGSFDTPYLTLTKAIEAANLIASASNPVAIMMGSGIYVEDNSVGALEITMAGVSIVGASASSVIIRPNTPANDLLLIDNTVRVADVTFQSTSPLATGVSLAAGNLSVFNNVRFINFLTGAYCAGGAGQNYGFNTCLFVSNVTGLDINDTRVECNTCTFFGTTVVAGPAVNTGINVTGANASLVTTGGVIGLCATGMNVTGNALTSASSIGFRRNSFDIIQDGASHLTLSGCTFEFTDSGSDIDVQISGAGTIAEIISCEFSGTSPLSVDQAIGIKVFNEGLANITGGVMHNYTTGIQAGLSTDTASTIVNASGLLIRNCTTDIIQDGTTTVLFNSCTASSSKITINDATNVELAFFDLDDNGALTIGSTANQNTILLQVAMDPTNHPGIDYKSSLYSAQAVGFDNTFGSASSLYSLSTDNADLVSVTTNRAKIAGLRLVSDTNSPVGTTVALRGWDINKNASTAELAFQYQNSDLIGQSSISQYTVMQLDGVNNQLQLPTAATQIVFASDTNLYRSAANVLKTDDNFIVGTLTASRAVVTDGSDQLSSSATTATEIGYVSGVTSSIQTQIDSKVSKAGDTMTGTLIMPAGSAASPSIKFTGSTNTGLSAATANTLSFDTNGSERMNIDGSGNVTINGFGTTGVVHNDSSGLLSSSLIVNADITNATISNAKLATISSSNTAGSIVVRDGSGNFATNMITILGTVTNNTDVATKAYVDTAVSTGIVAKDPALVLGATNITLSGLQTIDGVSLAANDRVLLINQTDPIENGLWLAQSGAWTRPVDFANGNTAGQAYVLILSGSVNAGASYLCNTPTAIIGTDPIGFALFSLPDTTAGANVGTGTGLVFKNKTGSTLNFRSLLADTHMSIVSNTDDITIGTDATSANTASTIVARDGSGNFSAGIITASLTGAASLNVLKTGDTMTGALTMPAGTIVSPSLKFTGSASGTGITAETANVLSFDISGTEIMNVGASGVTIDAFGTAGVVHNNSSGLLSSSLIVNADVSASAGIVDTKLATISTAGKVANSATTATSANTPSTIVLRDGSGNFVAGTITANLTGSASNNVLKAGDTMTGTLQLPAGTTALPSLVFTGSTTTGLSANAGDLSFSTNGIEQLKIASGGSISIDAFTTAGVVHNDASGNLTSSLIVNADVSPTAAIIDTKLATIVTTGKVANSATTATSDNTASTIVLRDSLGNFSAGAVSFTDAIIDNLTISNCIASVCVTALSVVDESVSGTLSVADEVINNSLTITPLSTAGVVHNNSSGLLSSSLIVNADVSPSAAIVDTKLATISTAGKVANSATTATSANTANAIVARDASGNFSAGTITANLTGAASANVLKAGDTMTGTLTLPAGTAAVPSLQFTGSVNTGISAENLNTLSFDTNGVEAMNIDGSGNVTITGFTSAGVIHNDSSGLLSSSLIVNADVSASAAIVDTKLATISTAGKVANSATTATSANTANTIVLRNASGNFSAGSVSFTDAVIDNLTIANCIASACVTALSVADESLTGTLSVNDEVLNGTFTITPFSTSGIVHNNASGLLSSSLIVNADITNATISNAKLATISSADTAGNIVVRDGSGNFATNMITIDGTVTNPTDVATKAYVDSATSAVTGANVGTGTGLIFRDKTGNNINFKSLVQSNHIVITNNANDITLATDGTNLNTSSTLVARDAAGNFSASIISMTDGVASGNLVLTAEPSTSTTGNIMKGSSRFIHDFGTNNTFVGISAGNFTMSGSGNNTAIGNSVLTANTTGAYNTAMGSGVLAANTIGTRNTALGYNALAVSTTGNDNTALGYNALAVNATGTSFNTAVGSNTLAANTTGNDNTAVGYQALVANITGSNNIAIGYQAGQTLTTGSGNIYVNADAATSSESSTIRIGTNQIECYIAGITGVGVSGDGVVVDSNGQLGITLSSRRYKHDIEDMGSLSSDILKLRPVTFAYNNDLSETTQYGLIAEEVDQIFPAIVAKDEHGNPYTVRYHLLPVLLLNELQKQHATIEAIKQQYVTVEEMNKAIGNLQKQIQNFTQQNTAR